MNINRHWHQNNRGRSPRGGFRGGRGGNRGWSGSYRGFKGQRDNMEGYSGGNRYHNNQNRNSNSKGMWLRERRETPGKRLSEEEIGVTEYISKHEGFNGIIKSRYSDFQVSEINESGEVAKLTSTEPPEPQEDELVSEDEDLLFNKYNVEILPLETWDKINTLAVTPDPEPDCVEIDMAGVTKEQRTKIHDAVKKAFGDSIVGSTINIDDKKLMRFQKYKKGVRVDNRVKWTWPGEYVYFVVHKENTDTMEAAARIAERIGVHMKPSMLGYAGTKDRRAKTSQWFSARRIDPRRLASACRGLKDIYIGNYTFKDANLKLGMLKGNRFRIALRNVTASDETIEIACQHLKDHGFINYYGLQRFGSRFDTPTYDIGLKLLQGNFKEAINMILRVRPGPLELALSAYAASGPIPAARLLSNRVVNTAPETRLIKSLAGAPNDLIGALGKLARNTRLLYIHSYQSLVWNSAVSERLRRHGLKPAPGDLVPLAHLTLEDELDDGESDSEVEENQKDGEKPQEDLQLEDTRRATEKDRLKLKDKVPVKVLTQEDVDSGKYTIADIVLPLPGYMIEYPPNMVEFYEQMLKKDGLTMEMRHKIKSYSMSGAYRHMVVKPLELSHTTVRYTDPYADLIASDIDQINGKTLNGIIEDGKYKALLLTMSLPASCYATMALRELLKVDTSSDTQALQNNYHKTDDKRESTKEEGNNGENEGDSGEKRKLREEGVEEAKKQKIDE